MSYRYAVVTFYIAIYLWADEEMKMAASWRHSGVTWRHQQQATA